VLPDDLLDLRSLLGASVPKAVFHAFILRQAYETCKWLILAGSCGVSKLTPFDTGPGGVLRIVFASDSHVRL
jgi:hypothetical protein